MNKEFIPYEQALALKELEFNEPCVYYVDKDNNSYIYNFQTHPDEFIEGCGVNVIPTPTFSQAFRWFRDNKNISGEVYSEDFGGCIEYSFHIRDLYSEKEIFDNFFGAGSSYSGTFNTYEEAEQACLDKLIAICQKKNSIT